MTRSDRRETHRPAPFQQIRDGASVLRGALAAAVTPLDDDGTGIDEHGVESLMQFLASGGVDGALILGTTGEGILLSAEERRRAAELFIEANRGRLTIAVHCGAQTTSETVKLAEHAATVGAQAVAVIPPPYYRLDDLSLLNHFLAAARVCEPLPFYLYEFEARSGYPIPISVIAELRKRAPNVVGLKVSDTPYEHFEKYLLKDLDIFVGPEALIWRGLQGGAIGAVSAIATAFPELVSRHVRDPSEESSTRLAALRSLLERFPFQAVLKTILRRRGVEIFETVRRPLRALTPAERRELEQLDLGESLEIPRTRASTSAS